LPILIISAKQLFNRLRKRCASVKLSDLRQIRDQLQLNFRKYWDWPLGYSQVCKKGMGQ
jgi:hypothetical protein